MVFWYVSCLNFLKMHILTSYHLRQGHSPVKQRLLRSFVSDMVKRHVKTLCFLLKMIRNGVLHNAHREVVLVAVSEICLFPGVFIVLRNAGEQNFTREISLPRARDAEIKSFENGSHPSRRRSTLFWKGGGQMSPVITCGSLKKYARVDSNH
ncbi:hypothetical protein V202x_24470 [Gimesia aquarii]|uniref:Uncharacterized protein n=1 Tax=Gimesia aquarii TaxID=2527964 RepID=A0A517WV08_9PLAN|nr:hypothetical protein V202x_24470 [Gimesia aquarii]